MKKYLTLVFALIFCFTLTSCASDNKGSTSDINTSNDSSDNITTNQSASIDYANPNQNTGYNQDAVDVTIIQLIATPEKYHNSIVRVIGVGNIEFEGNAVYLSKDDWKYCTRNSIWLDFYNESAGEINGKYVVIEGTFNMYDTGHMGLFSGSIEKVTRYQLLGITR